MKNFRNFSKNWYGRAGLCSLFTLLLSSCLKNDNNYYYPPVALVNFIQASPGEPLLDFYLDNDQVNPYPINYNTGTGYFRAYAGTRAANFYNTGTTTKVFSGSIQLVQNTTYSLFLANKPSTPELVLLTDTLNQPSGQNAAVRFINLSPDAPAVTIAIQGGKTLTGVEPYKGFTTFLPVQGNTTYTFQVVQGSNGTVLATLPGVTLNSGSVYTIWFHGLAASTSNADQLAASIYTNAVY